MLEPDVTLTDLALTAQCTAFSVLLIRRSRGEPDLFRLFAALFTSLAASSFLGAVWHGVFSDSDTVAGRWIWFATMAALAVASAILWYIAAALLRPGRWQGLTRRLARFQLVTQLVISAFVTDAFVVGAIGMSLPVVPLVHGYLRVYKTTGARRALVGVAGFALAVLSGLVIVFDVSLAPRWASANAVYHVLQFVAFWLIFLSVSAVALQRR